MLHVQFSIRLANQFLSIDAITPETHSFEMLMFQSIVKDFDCMLGGCLVFAKSALERSLEWGYIT